MTEEEWDFSLSWRIENFASCGRETGVKINSPIFTVESLENTKWYFSIFPGGEEEEDYGDVVIYLCKNSDNQLNKKVNITYRVEASNDDGNYYTTGPRSEPFFPGERQRHWCNIEKKTLTLLLKNDGLNTLILHCPLRSTNTIKRSLVDCEARTRLIPDKCIFEWRLNLTLIKDLQLSKGKIYFFLESILYEMSIAIPQDDLVLCIRNVTKMPMSSSSSRITGKVSLLNVRGNEAYFKEDSHVFNSLTEKDIWEFPSFVSKQEILDNFNEIVEQGTVVFLCEFFAFRETLSKNTIITSLASVSFVENLLELREDFQKLLSNGNHSDVNLHVDNKQLQVHKSVLAARSPVFSAMFDKEMLETLTGVVEIPDVDLTTLKSFLKFLYTGSVEDMDFEAASKLLMVADKYQVPSLTEQCALYLRPNIDETNVCEVLVLADLVHHEGLKSAALEFAAEHFLAIFPSTEQSGWITENMKLFSEILSLLSKNFQINPKKISDE